MTRISCWLFVFTLALGACTSDRDRFSSRTQKMEADAYNVKCGDGKCDPVVEDCGKCPQDCKGPCTGCQPKVTPGCTGCLCETCVCAKDPTCCNKVWDSVCVSHCKACTLGCGLIPEAGMPDMTVVSDKSLTDLSPPQPDGVPDLGPPVCGNSNCEPWGKEDCDSCPKDCNYDKIAKKAKPCDGCQAKFKPGCKNCKCEKCVCIKDPWCCLMYWDRDCAKSCKFDCKGGCGLTGSDMGASPDQALPDGFGLKCGDKTCVSGKEFCDTCPKDCGKCDGCSVKKNPGCKGCKCEKEVCNKPGNTCCTAGWGNECVTLCKYSTLGCGQLPDSGPDMPPSDKGVDTADMSEDAILAQYDMNYQGDGYNKNNTDWRSNPKYWEAGGNYTPPSKWGSGCNCELTPTRPPPYLFLLLLGGLLLLARRRR